MFLKLGRFCPPKRLLTAGDVSEFCGCCGAAGVCRAEARGAALTPKTQRAAPS